MGPSFRRFVPILLLCSALGCSRGCGCGPEEAETRGPLATQLPDGLVMSLVQAQAPFEPYEAVPVVEGRPVAGERLEELLELLPPLDAVPDEATELRASVLPPEGEDEPLQAFPPPAEPLPPGTSDPGPFRVTGFSPEGEVLRVPHLSLRFSRPVVSDAEPMEPPVTLSPAAAGQWRWLGSRNLQFVPEEPLPMATDYTVVVPAEVAALDGGKIAEEARYTFSTAPPGVVAWHPGEVASSPRPVIVIAFDQCVDPRAMIRFVSLAAVSGLEIPFDQASTAEVYADWYAGRMAEEAGPGQWIAVRPRLPLPQDSGYRVTVVAGAPSAEGRRKTAVDQSTTFVTPKPLRVVEHRCFPDESCPAGEPLLIHFNNALDAETVDVDTWFVEPPAPELRVETLGPTVAVEGLTGERHVITLPATVTDVFGQPLGARYPVTYTTGGQAVGEADADGVAGEESEDLHVAVHPSAAGLLVWVASAVDGSVVAGARVSALPDGGSATTDEAGLATIPHTGEAAVARVVATATDGTVGSSEPPDAAAWRPVAPGESLRWYATTGVSAHAPGRDVNVKGWVRRVSRHGDVRELGESPRRIAWQLLDEAGEILDEGLADLGLYGGFDLAAALPRTVAGDRVRVRFKAVAAPDVDGTTHEIAVPVYRLPLNNLAARVESEDLHHVAGETAVIGVQAFGGPGGHPPGARVTWTVEARSTDFVPPGREGFRFGPAAADGPDPRPSVLELEGRTDAEGRHWLGLEIESLRSARSQRVTTRAVVVDSRRALARDQAEVFVHPSAWMIGLNPVQPVIEPGQEATVEAIVVDPHGEAVPGVDVSARLERRTGADDPWVPLEDGACEVTSAASPVSCSFGPRPAGQYRVTAAAADEMGRESSAQVTLIAAGAGPGDGVHEPVLFARRAEVGEVAEIGVAVPFHPARGWLTVWRTDLVETRIVEIDEPFEILEIALDESHAPDLRIHLDVVEVGPPEGRARRAGGEMILPVPPTASALDVVAMPREREVIPGGETSLQLAVMDADGKPVMGAEVAVVAAELVPVPPEHAPPPGQGAPDPGHTFYPRRGGDGSGPTWAAAESAWEVTRLFAPAVFTDASGTARLPLQMPNAPLRVRVDVVAAAGGARFGVARTEVVGREALEVDVGLPEVLGHGDEIDLPIDLHNGTGEGMSVEIALRSDQLVLGEAADRVPSVAGVLVTLPAGTRSRIRVPCTTRAPGEAVLQVLAASGTLRVPVEARTRVREPADTQRAAVHGEIGTGHVELPVRVPSGAVPTAGGLDVTISVNPLQQLTDALAAVAATPPHGSEALASRVLAVAALRDDLWSFRARGMPDPQALEQGVMSDLAGLTALQEADGGFAAYELRDVEHPFFGIHAAHALAVAKDHGYHVSWGTWSLSQRYLRQLELHLPQWISRESRWALRAYALAVLHRMGAGDADAARVLLREAGTEKLPLEAHAWLLPVLYDDDDDWDVHEILDHLRSRATETETRAHFATGYSDGAQVLLHSHTRANAVILGALAEVAPDDPLTAKLAAGLLEDRQQGRWTTSQENAFALLAMIQHVHAGTGAEPDLLARAWLGDRLAGENLFRGRITDRVDVHVPMATLAEVDGDLPLTLARKGRGSLHYRAAVHYVPIGRESPPVDAGLAVHRAYEAVDDLADVTRDDDGSWHMREGARVRVKLTVATPVQRYHVRLDDRLPAGLELLHPEPPADLGDPPAAADEEQIERYWWWWRPWYDHEVLDPHGVQAFSGQLWEGVHTYTYLARAVTPGRYEAPPALAEERYTSATYGRSAGERVVVE